MRKLFLSLALLLACFWPLSGVGEPRTGTTGGWQNTYYGINSGVAGDAALQALYELEELKAPQTNLRKMYFSAEVGGDIPTIGVDTNDCLSISAPCKSFERASEVCGGLSDCIFDAQDTWTGTDVTDSVANAGSAESGQALNIRTSSIGGNFVSTRIRSSDPHTRVNVNCVGTDWSDGEDGIFVLSSGTDMVSIEGFEVNCDPTALSPAHDQVDAFDGKENTRMLVINSGCTLVGSFGDEQCFTTHGGGAASTGGLLVALNTESSISNALYVTNFGMNDESTIIAIGNGLHTVTSAGKGLIARITTGRGARYYFIGHSFSGTGLGNMEVVNLGNADCTTECNFEFARVQVTDMVDSTPGNDTGLIYEAGVAGQVINLVTNQVTFANQTRAVVLNGAAGTFTWNGSGNLFESISNFQVWVGPNRSLGGTGPVEGTITETVYDLSGGTDFYANGGTRATIALLNSNMGASFSFAEDAESADGNGSTLLSNSSACDPSDSDCFDAFDGSYTIAPLFLDAAITFPKDILGVEFQRFTLSGGNIGGR